MCVCVQVLVHTHARRKYVCICLHLGCHCWMKVCVCVRVFLLIQLVSLWLKRSHEKVCLPKLVIYLGWDHIDFVVKPADKEAIIGPQCDLSPHVTY